MEAYLGIFASRRYKCDALPLRHGGCRRISVKDRAIVHKAFEKSDISYRETSVVKARSMWVAGAALRHSINGFNRRSNHESTVTILLYSWYCG